MRWLLYSGFAVAVLMAAAFANPSDAPAAAPTVAEKLLYHELTVGAAWF